MDAQIKIMADISRSDVTDVCLARVPGGTSVRINRETAIRLYLSLPRFSFRGSFRQSCKVLAKTETED